MGFKKMVTLVCDGPCGMALPEQEKAPVGWSKLMIQFYERLEQGQKPTHAPMSGWYCPKCTTKVCALLTHEKFSLNWKQEEGANG